MSRSPSAPGTYGSSSRTEREGGGGTLPGPTAFRLPLSARAPLWSGDTHVVDVRVTRLRAEIGRDRIETVRGFGDKLRA
ncbi:hypothetical protein GCM10018790_51580 [Kitasatospora xanthocidica]|nr:hypothetical protein GCM10018790_51580 [Kitasatospora xanthocidica]